MAKIKGTVTKASKAKYGYFLMLDGNDFYFNTKFEPKCGEGDVVGIEYEQKGESRGQIKRVQVLEDNSGGYKSSNSESSYGGKSGGNGGASGGSRQDSIIWQSCQKVAASLVAAEVAAGSVASSGNANSKQQEIKGRFDELTVALFEDASDPKNSDTYATVKGIEKDAGGEESSNDDGDEWSDDDEWS